MTINHKVQIQELNKLVLTKIAPSKIHGVGVFAIQDIPKGAKLYADMMPIVYNLPYKKFNELRPEVTEQILGQFPQVVNGSAFCYPTIRLQAYMNHSDEANYNAFDDITLRDIKAGDEITENYRLIEGHKKVFAFLK